jgi:hypothetical protein
MASCININSAEFQALKEKSGLSTEELKGYCYYYIDKCGRFPYLDEIAEANSSKYLTEKLELNENGGTSAKKILDYTQSESIEEATHKINDTHRDVEVDITPVLDRAIVRISKRPSFYQVQRGEQVVPDEVVNSRVLLNTALTKLARLYGINFKSVTTDELRDMFGNKMPDVYSTKAFVYNNEVYINTDLATADTPVHEMLHLLLGSIRYSDPDLYYNLVNLVDKLPQRDTLARMYKNRTRQDINEEIFVE